MDVGIAVIVVGVVLVLLLAPSRALRPGLRRLAFTDQYAIMVVKNPGNWEITALRLDPPGTISGEPMPEIGKYLVGDEAEAWQAVRTIEAELRRKVDSEWN